MIRISKVIEWDMGHRVPNHKSKCRNLHGHRYRLELTVTGELVQTNGASSEGMIIDFADLKQAMMESIHDVLDHGYMVCEQDKVMLDFFAENEDQNFRVIKVPFIPTSENIARWCYEQLEDSCPGGVRIVNCRVFETPNSWADYSPGGTSE